MSKRSPRITTNAAAARGWFNTLRNAEYAAAAKMREAMAWHEQAMRATTPERLAGCLHNVYFYAKQAAAAGNLRLNGGKPKALAIIEAEAEWMEAKAAAFDDSSSPNLDVQIWIDSDEPTFCANCQGSGEVLPGGCRADETQACPDCRAGEEIEIPY